MLAVTTTMPEFVLLCLLADSGQDMPTLRAALSWAIRVQCDMQGIHPPEGVFEFVVNILVDSSM